MGRRPVFRETVVPTAHQYEIPDELVALLKLPNMYFEILFLAFWREYPFLGAEQMIRRLCDELGPEKMMWGTYQYVVQGWCTYRQALNDVRNSELLSEEEKALILGGNAARMFATVQFWVYFSPPCPSTAKARVAIRDFSRRSRDDLRSIDVISTSWSTSSPWPPSPGQRLSHKSKGQR